MDEPGSGWISRSGVSPAEEQPQSRAGSVGQKGCGKGSAAHTSPAAPLGAAAMGCQQQVPHGRAPYMLTLTQHLQLHIHVIYSTLGHTPCCLSSALNPREASLVVPHRQLLYHGNGHSSSHLPTQHPPSDSHLSLSPARRQAALCPALFQL